MQVQRGRAFAERELIEVDQTPVMDTRLSALELTRDLALRGGLGPFGGGSGELEGQGNDRCHDE